MLEELGPEERRPGDVPDADGARDTRYSDITLGFDTDGDGHPDTAVTGDGVDLVVLTDLDGDGLADQVLRIGPDGVVREAVAAPAPPAAGILHGLQVGADLGTEP